MNSHIKHALHLATELESYIKNNINSDLKLDIKSKLECQIKSHFDKIERNTKLQLYTTNFQQKLKNITNDDLSGLNRKIRAKIRNWIKLYENLPSYGYDLKKIGYVSEDGHHDTLDYKDWYEDIKYISKERFYIKKLKYPLEETDINRYKSYDKILSKFGLKLILYFREIWNRGIDTYLFEVRDFKGFFRINDMDVCLLAYDPNI